MGIFDRIFRRKKDAESALAPLPGQKPATDPATDPNMIKVFDAYGRELFITRDDWRESVLKGSLEQAWDDPERLGSQIVQLLHDGFLDEVVRPAERLAAIDPDAELSAVLLGIAYLENGRLDDAEAVLSRYIARRGESGTVMTNLAKVYAKRGETARCEDTLWRGLRADPNQDNGLLWFRSLRQERDGAEAGIAALREVAALPRSWRAHLWLARAALERQELSVALLLYRQALQAAVAPVPADLLMQLTGDLGNHGYIAEILELTVPHYDAAVHGIEVGNNLIKSLVELGRINDARELIAQLYAQQRPDWRQTLSFWETEVAQRLAASTSVPTEDKLKATMLTIEGPVWLAPDSAAATLFPSVPVGGEAICFLGSSAKVAEAGTKSTFQFSNAVGRLSRSFPLFLAEQTYFQLQSPVQTLVPWIISPTPGFILSGAPCTDVAAIDAARQLGSRPSIIVVTHVVASGEPWRITARVLRIADGACLGEYSGTYSPQRPDVELRPLAEQIVRAIADANEVMPQAMPVNYQVPQETDLADYLLRLEQLLVTRCAAMDGVPTTFLSGEREIVGGAVRLCVAQPTNVPARLLLAQVLRRMKPIAPAAVSENAEVVRLLQRQYPLPAPAHEVVDQLLMDTIGR